MFYTLLAVAIAVLVVILSNRMNAAEKARNEQEYYH